MARTFSLACLMLVITLLCIICGLVVNFPEEAAGIVVLALFYVPTPAICLTLVRFSRQRILVLILSIIGAFIGLLFAPAVMHMGPAPRAVWKEYLPPIVELFLYPPLGALLLGGSILADEIRQRRMHLPDNES